MGWHCSWQWVMDTDLDDLSRDELTVELIRLRNAVRAHRDSTGYALCWHH